jgi:hypothetical protein
LAGAQEGDDGEGEGELRFHGCLVQSSQTVTLL